MRAHEELELTGTLCQFLKQMTTTSFKEALEIRLKEFIDVDDEGNIVDPDADAGGNFGCVTRC